MTNTGLRKMCTWLLVLAVLHQTGNLCASAADPEDKGNVPVTDVTGTTSPEPTAPTTVLTLSSEATSATTVTSTEDTKQETAGTTGSTTETEQPTSTLESTTASTDVTTSASSDDSTANSTEAVEVTTVDVSTTTETIEGTTSNITDTGSGGDSKDETDKGDIRLGIGITAAFLLVIGLSGALFYVIVRRHNRNYSRLDEELLVNYNNGDNISNASSDVSETIDPSGDLELDMDPIGTELQGRTLQTF